MSVSRSHAVWFQGSLPGKTVLLSASPSYLSLVDFSGWHEYVRGHEAVEMNDPQSVWVFSLLTFSSEASGYLAA